MSDPEARIADDTAAAIADPEIQTDFDPETIGALMRERGVSEMEIATVENPDGFRVRLDGDRAVRA